MDPSPTEATPSKINLAHAWGVILLASAALLLVFMLFIRWGDMNSLGSWVMVGVPAFAGLLLLKIGDVVKWMQ